MPGHSRRAHGGCPAPSGRSGSYWLRLRLCRIRLRQLSRRYRGRGRSWRISGGYEDGIGRFVALGRMDAQFHPHADAHVEWRELLDAAHQAETFIHVDKRDVVGIALLWIDGRGGVDGAQALADAPLQIVLTGVGTDDARVEYSGVGIRAELVGELALFQVFQIDPEGGCGRVCHYTGRSPWTVT